MHRIIGNPTVTPRAVPTKLSQLENDAQFITKDALSEIDVEGIPSVVYTELDNFTDGVCKVISKSPDEPLYFSNILGGFIEEGNVYVLSEMYALCLANYVYYDESEQYRTVSQTLIFPGGAIYCRNRHVEDTSDGWSEGVWNEWKPFTVELAQKAYRDGNNKIITDTYATKEELGDYATKDDLSGIDGEGIPSIIYTDLDNFTDGVCKITMNGEWGLFDGEIFNTEYSEWVNSEMYALCLANDIEGDTYHMYSQTLIFPDGGIYKRSKNSDFDYGTGEWSDATWSKWQPFRAYEATKAYADVNGKNIATTYATKEELADIDKAYELIDTITITEAVSRIDITNEPDGTPYSFKKLFVKYTFPKLSASTWITFKFDNTNFKLGDYMGSTSYKTIYQLKVGVENGLISADFSYHTNDIPNPSNAWKCAFSYIKTTPIDRFIVDAGAIPVGATFEIWGVRA
jgi:hypothetical protein